MIKKLLIGIFLLLLTTNVFANKFNIYYNYSQGNDWNRFVRGLEYSKKTEKENHINYYDFKIKETELGSSFKFNTNSEFDINDRWDYWSGLSYYNDTILKVMSEIDLKVGFGYYLVKEESFLSERKIKLSYGLIYRNKHFLHSFRFKDTFRFAVINYKLMVNYILPNGEKNFDRLDVEFIPGLKVMNFEPSFSYNYVKTFDKEYFETKFMLGVEF
jgi:hypothetical protein